MKIVNMKIVNTSLVVIMVCLALVGCWNQTDHELDDNISATMPDDTATTVVNDNGDTSSASAEFPQNSMLDDRWKGFGSPCEDVSDCAGYPSENKLCLHDVLGYINIQGGYCTACCNTPGKDVCGKGIDCVGVDGVALVCIARCNGDTDCRTDEFHECRAMYYLEKVFLDNYCLPDEEHMEPEGASEDLSCPWPW